MTGPRPEDPFEKFRQKWGRPSFSDVESGGSTSASEADPFMAYRHKWGRAPAGLMTAGIEGGELLTAAAGAKPKSLLRQGVEEGAGVARQLVGRGVEGVANLPADVIDYSARALVQGPAIGVEMAKGADYATAREKVVPRVEEGGEAVFGDYRKVTKKLGDAIAGGEPEGAAEQVAGIAGMVGGQVGAGLAGVRALRARKMAELAKREQVARGIDDAQNRVAAEQVGRVDESLGMLERRQAPKLEEPPAPEPTPAPAAEPVAPPAPAPVAAAVADEPERIVGVAMKDRGKKYTDPAAVVHSDLIEKFGLDDQLATYGFVTNKGRFVNRKQAQKIAGKQGQLGNQGAREDTLDPTELHSTDFIEPAPAPVAPAVADEPERVAAAALLLRDGRTLTGQIHADAYSQLEAAGYSFDDIDRMVERSGFVTSRGRFVLEEEAEQLGRASGQVVGPVSGKIASEEMTGLRELPTPTPAPPVAAPSVARTAIDPPAGVQGQVPEIVAPSAPPAVKPGRSLGFRKKGDVYEEVETVLRPRNRREGQPRPTGKTYATVEEAMAGTGEAPAAPAAAPAEAALSDRQHRIGLLQQQLEAVNGQRSTKATRARAARITEQMRKLKREEKAEQIATGQRKAPKVGQEKFVKLTDDALRDRHEALDARLQAVQEQVSRLLNQPNAPFEAVTRARLMQGRLSQDTKMLDEVEAELQRRGVKSRRQEAVDADDVEELERRALMDEGAVDMGDEMAEEIAGGRKSSFFSFVTDEMGALGKRGKKGGPERIVAAALRDDSGEVFTGASHMEAYQKWAERFGGSKLTPPSEAEGFVTGTGRFLTRDEASYATRQVQLNSENLPAGGARMDRAVTPRTAGRVERTAGLLGNERGALGKQGKPVEGPSLFGARSTDLFGKEAAGELGDVGRRAETAQGTTDAARRARAIVEDPAEQFKAKQGQPSPAYLEAQSFLRRGEKINAEERGGLFGDERGALGAEAEQNLGRFLEGSVVRERVFHGTRGDFSQFKKSKDIGYHFGDQYQADHRVFGGIEGSQRLAAISPKRNRAQKGPNIMPVYLSLKNPIRFEVDPGSFSVDAPSFMNVLEQKGVLTADEIADLYAVNDQVGDRAATKKLRALLQSKGHDGIVYPNSFEGDGDSYVVFDPRQVKSATGNRGTFSSATADITGALGKRGVVGVDQARRLKTRLELPQDDVFRQAVANTEGAAVTDEGLVINLSRWQKPEQAGEQSVRSGVFYLPLGAKQAKHYRHGQTTRYNRWTGEAVPPREKWYGGTEQVAGQTLIRRPFFVKGGTGGKAPEAALKQLIGKEKFAEMDEEISGFLNRSYFSGSNLERRVNPEHIEAFLVKWGGDPDAAGHILEHSKQGNQLRYALSENVAAGVVRSAGYDAVVGHSKGKAGPFISEVFDVRERSYPVPGDDVADVHDAFRNTEEGAGALSIMGGMVGAGGGFTAGAATAPDDATPAERIARGAAGAAVGVVGGVTLGRAIEGLGLRATQQRATSPAAQAILNEPAAKTTVSGIADAVRSASRRAYQQLVDDVYAARRFGRDIGKSEALAEEASRAKGWRGYADVLIGRREGRYATPTLRRAIESAKGREADVTALLRAERAIELDDAGKGWYLAADRQTAEAVAQGAKPEVQQAAQHLREFYDHLLELRWKSGILSDAEYQAIRQAGQHYVPFVPEERAAERLARAGGGKLFNRSKNVRRLTEAGSAGGYAKVDPWAQAVEDAQSTARDVSRQRAWNTAAEIVESTPKASDWIREVTPQQLATKRTTGRLIQAVRQGERKTYEVLDPDLYEALQSVTVEPSVISKFLSAPARGLRAGVTIMPSFGLANAGRDAFFTAGQFGFPAVQGAVGAGVGAGVGATLDPENPARGAARGAAVGLGAGVMGTHGARIARGIGHIARNDLLYQSWMREGGSGGGFFARSHADAVKMVGEMRGVSPASVLKPTSWWHALEALNRAIEEAPRVAKYADAVKQGAPGRTAAVASREVSLDFSRGGSKTAGLRSATAFWNPKIQGFDKLRTILNPVKNPKGYAIGVATMTAPTIALWSINKDDPEYRRRPSWEKNLFWLVPTSKDAQGVTQFLRIPKPFEVGMVFASLPERMLDFAYERDPERTTHALKEMLGSTMEGVLPIPTLLQAPLEAAVGDRGWDTFRNREIVTRDVEKLPNREQYNADTPGAAIAASRGVEALTGAAAKGVELATGGAVKPKPWAPSPQKVAHVARGFTGTAGDRAMALADRAAKQVGLDDRPEAPVRRRNQFERFVTQPAGFQSEDIATIWRRFESGAEHMAQLKALVEAKKGPEAKSYARQHAGELKDYLSLKGAVKDQRTMARVRRHIEQAPNLSGEQKTRLIRRLGALAATTAQGATTEAPVYARER